MSWRPARGARAQRIEVHLRADVTERERRELAAFARYCVARLERALGAEPRWVVTAVRERAGGYTSTVVVHRKGGTVEASGRSHEATAAVWEALVVLEERLRAARAP